MEFTGEIKRDATGVPHIKCETENELYFNMGYVHAIDRGLQLLLMRILGKGRASELLDASDEMLEVDIFFRKMNWSGNMHHQVEQLPDTARELCVAYCEGINAAFMKKKPWECKLLGYRPEPWMIEDSILLSRMIGYLTLSQSQAELERFVVEMVQRGISENKLDELFPGLLEGLDCNLLKKVTLQDRIVPEQLRWHSVVPRMMASNNWVVSGAKTASGKPILANDPHLEMNRLPNVWYELVVTCGERYIMGVTMPGLPGFLIGRNPDLAWGVTYSFMDTVDSWIEKCQAGTYYREPETWHPFVQRKEIIYRKNKEMKIQTFFENDHGVLDGDPLQGGYYLSTRWSAAQSGAVSITAIQNMFHVSSVEEGMEHLGRMETSWNWVLADQDGNIGYQMSGLMPERRVGISGLIPLPGWNEEYDWQGFVSFRDLPQAVNPEQGYFVTANQDLNEYCQLKPINMPMGPYRAQRIAHLLEQQDSISGTDMYEIQYDVFSIQAEQFLAILRPLLPETAAGDILRDWDCRYTSLSRGAYLFEQFYKALFLEVFGKNGVGVDVFEYLDEETGLFVDFYLNFDRILLSENSSWFNGENRETLFKRVAAQSLTIPARPWGETREVTLSNIMFGGKLPRLLGFDKGPIKLRGGRATVHQGQIYRSAHRLTTFAPSYRMVTDLALNTCFTNMVGGPSDRRFSRSYCSDLQNLLAGKYKSLSPNISGSGITFS